MLLNNPKVPNQIQTQKPVVCPQRGASRSQEIETRSFREEAVKHDRRGKPVVWWDENHEHPTVVCSEQTTHPRFSREGQNLILEEETNHDRTEKPVVCPQAGAPKLVSLVTAWTSMWKMKQNTIERGNPLFAVMQITSAQCETRLISTSEYLDCHILFWNKLITIVFVNSWRRSRTTLTDNLFNEIYNKKSLQPVQCNVQENDSGHGQRRPRRSAKNAYHIGVKASSIVPAGISWKKVQPSEASSNMHWTFSQFQTTWLRRDDLMATDVGKLHNKMNIIKPIIWKRDALRGVIKGSTVAFWSIPNFVHPRSNVIEMKRSVSKWTSLRTRISPITWRKQDILGYNQKWWIFLNKSGHTGPLRNRSDFNEALSTLNRLHQESGERQLKPMPFWKYQQWQKSSSSSSSWWQWSDSWWSS